MRDLKNNIQVKALADPADLAHADTWLGYVDTHGFQGVVIGIQVGALTGVDGSNYLTPTLYEASTTPGTASNYSTVAAGDINGAFTKIDATSEDSVVQTVGYVGGKRYVGLKAVYTGTAISAGIVGAFVVAGLADEEPADATLTVGTIS